MNDPPDQTAELSAANLLSVGGMIVEKYWRHQVRVFLYRGVGVGEDHALVCQVFLQRAVDDFAFELGLHAGEVFLLGLGNAQPVERALDLLGHVVPRAALVFGRLEVVVDVLEVEGDVAAPARHRLGVENLQAVEPELAHPLRLVLHVGNLADDLGIEAFAGLEDRLGSRAEVVLVDFADDVGCRGECNVGCHSVLPIIAYRNS